MSTVAPSSRISDPQVASAAQTDFPAGFPLPSADSDGGYSSVAVHRLRAGVETILLFGDDFTVVDVTDSDFTARLNVGATAGDVMRVVGAIDPSRASTYRAGSLDSAALERELTRLVQLLQEGRRDIARAAKSPFGEKGLAIAPAVDLDGKMLYVEDGKVKGGATKAQFDGDVAQVAADRIATGQDRTATGLDRTATSQDRTATGQDRVATGQDRTAVHDDRVLTEAAVDAFTTLTGDLGAATVAEVAANIHDDAQQVATDKGTVTTLAGQVADDKADIDANIGDLDGLTVGEAVAQVGADKTTTQGYKNEAAASAASVSGAAADIADLKERLPGITVLNQTPAGYEFAIGNRARIVFGIADDGSSHVTELHTDAVNLRYNGAAAGALTVTNIPGFVWSVANRSRVAGGFKDDGSFEVGDLAALNQVTSPKVVFDDTLSLTSGKLPGWALAIANRTRIAVGVTDDGVLHAGQLEDVVSINGTPIAEIGAGTGADFSDGELGEIDRQALAASVAERAATVTGIQPLSADINDVVVVGQSYAEAARSWPPFTLAALAGTYMLGNSEHPNPSSDTTFTEIGTTAFNPLIGTVINGSGTILNDASLNALVGSNPTSTAEMGESFGVTAVRHLRRRQVAALQLDPSSTAKGIVLTNCAKSGKTIEQLSKGATPNYFGRMVSAVTKAKAEATRTGKSYALAAIIIDQGQSNYLQTGGATNDYTAFKALYDQYLDDIQSDVVVGAAGQTTPPAIFIISPAADYFRDAGNIGIGNAFLALSRERSNVFIVGSDYHVTNRASHLDANGSRWVGTHVGYALARVLIDGRRWVPLRPIYDGNTPRAYVRNKTLVLPLSADGGIAFGTPYQQRTAVDSTTKGFSLRDSGGVLSFSAVEIFGSNTLVFTLDRVASGTVYLHPLSESTVGNGFVKDSAASIADEVFKYDAARAQESEEDIAALVDQPYPSNNWIVPFDIPATAV